MATIDIDKLENKKSQSGGGWICACPACRLEGRDKTGNHLRVFPSGKYSCAINPGDREHNRTIWQLVGTDSDGIVDYHYCTEPKVEQIEYYPDSLMSKLIRNFSYWEARGITSSTMEQYEGGLAQGEGKLADRYVFALRDINSRIVGFQGRYIKEIPKWSKLARWKIIGKGSKSLALFDYKRVSQEVAQTGVVILDEGIGSILALRQAGIGGALPMFGVKPSSTLLAALIALAPKKIVISTNNEASGIGNEAAEDCRVKLCNFFNEDMVTIRLPPQKDWLDSSEEERLAFKKEIFH
jgi:hypothetical protein